MDISAPASNAAFIRIIFELYHIRRRRNQLKPFLLYFKRLAFLKIKKGY
jgi:hypothetical protein